MGLEIITTEINRSIATKLLDRNINRTFDAHFIDRIGAVTLNSDNPLKAIEEEAGEEVKMYEFIEIVEGGETEIQLRFWFSWVEGKLFDTEKYCIIYI